MPGPFSSSSPKPCDAMNTFLIGLIALNWYCGELKKYFFKLFMGIKL
jgi:hypothetical protein